MRVAVKPKEKTEETLALLNSFFDIFEPAQNSLETSLDNMNMTLHPLPLLLNVGAAERGGKDFYHFIEGISPTVGLLIEQLDEERMKFTIDGFLKANNKLVKDNKWGQLIGMFNASFSK